MLPLRTVILRHDRTGDSHYDLLVEHPDGPPGRGRLLAFRLPLSGVPGAACGFAMPHLSPRKILLHQLPNHRRHYLSYQGSVSGGRGRVRRFVAGRAIALLFTADRIDLRFAFPRTHFDLFMRRVAIDTWSAALVPVS